MLSNIDRAQPKIHCITSKIPKITDPQEKCSTILNLNITHMLSER